MLNIFFYKKKWLAPIICLCFFGQRAVSQSFYVNSGNIFQKVTITPTGCVTTNIPTCAGIATSIAVYKNTLYYSEGTRLASAVIDSNGMSGCKDILNVPGSNSLTASKQGILYMAGYTQLYRVDPAIPSVTFVGDMPYTAAGDLVFYNDALYMASSSGIIKVNIDTPSLSTIFVPYGGKTIYGLASVSYNCRLNKVYALTIGAGFTDIIEVDMVNGRFLSSAGRLPYVVLDAASEVEDGTLYGIRVKEFKIQPDCSVSDRATVTIKTEPAPVTYTYALGNMINTTGVFENVGPGNYPVRIAMPGGCVKDTAIIVPSYTIRKPTIQPLFENPTCRQEGKIWFTMNDNPSLFTVSMGAATFLANHVFQPAVRIVSF